MKDCSRCKYSRLTVCEKYKKSIYKIIHNIDECFEEKYHSEYDDWRNDTDINIQNEEISLEQLVEDEQTRKYEECINDYNPDDENDFEFVSFDDVLLRNIYRK